MANVSSKRQFASLYVIWTVFLIHVSCCRRLSLRDFDLRGRSCPRECVCYNNSSPNLAQTNVGFTVNCTGMKYGLFEGIHIPKPLPYNTTDLIVTEFFLGTLSLESFSHNSFLWTPRLNRLVLRNCHIHAISTETFFSSTLQSLLHIDLNSNLIEELHENTFKQLLEVENISIAYNRMQKIGKKTFKNLRNVKVINISHNWLKELDPETFHDVPSLEILDLSYNWLDTLPWENILQIPALKILGLRGNLWNCSCQMKNVPETNRSLLSGSQGVCRYPEWLNGTFLEDLTSDAFSHCLNTQQNYGITILIPITTILCIIIAVWYYSMSINTSGTSFDHEPHYICIGQIMYNIKDALHPAKAVYRGKMTDGREVAIKIRPRTKVENELKTLLHLAAKDRLHPNIIQYMCVENPPKSECTFLALELCSGDLMTAVMEHIDWLDDIKVNKDYIFQLASGICFLHEIGIQHRDIKPQNILWKRTISGVVLIISDFDLSHLTVDASPHKLYGTTGWAAPELRHIGKSRSSGKMDVFSLGCVFYFILTKSHPFGSILDPKECQKNIDLPEYKASLDAVYEHYNKQFHMGTMAEDLLNKMISYNANERIGHLDLIKHPFVLSEKGICDFFMDIGRYLKVKDDQVKELIEKLEEKAETVFDGKWIDKVPDKCVRTDLGTVEPEKICSLLKKIRNKIEHVMEIQKPDVLAAYSRSQYGVAVYYMTIFPKLVPYVYNILQSMQ